MVCDIITHISVTECLELNHSTNYMYFSLLVYKAYAYFAYAMAEACLDQFTRALALELGPKGVRVNSVKYASLLLKLHKMAHIASFHYNIYIIDNIRFNKIYSSSQLH